MNRENQHIALSGSDNTYVGMQIVGRNPEEGLPIGGVAFVIEVILQAFEWSISPVGKDVNCKNVFLLARSQESGKILASKQINTDQTKNCRKRTSLVFDSKWRPYNNSYVKFEVYPAQMGLFSAQQTTRQAVESGKVSPLATSRAIDMSISKKELKQKETFPGDAQKKYRKLLVLLPMAP